MAHDFFTPQPAIPDTNVAVYLLRWILHDWPDQYCVKILRALLPGLRDGSRVIVVETLIPPKGVLPPEEEKFLT